MECSKKGESRHWVFRVQLQTIGCCEQGSLKHLFICKHNQDRPAEKPQMSYIIWRQTLLTKAVFKKGATIGPYLKKKSKKSFKKTLKQFILKQLLLKTDEFDKYSIVQYLKWGCFGKKMGGTFEPKK